MHKYLVALLFLFSANIYAQEVIDIETKETLPAKEVTSPKNDLTKAAIERISLENIESFIGSEKLKANEEKIKDKIIPTSRKYILSLRTGKIEKIGQNYVMDLQVKLSLKNLRAVLLDNGLLYEIKGTPQILPVVRISDQVALQSYAWWDASQSGGGFAKGAYEMFLKKMDAGLKSTNYKLKTPVQNKKLNPIYGGEKISVSQALQMAEAMGASIVVLGDILFTPSEKKGTYQVKVHLSALQTSNGRVMADVIREYQTEPGSYKNVIVSKYAEASKSFVEALTVQLEDAWNKGTYGTHQLKLIVRSDLSPKNLESFKKTLLIKIRDIKGIRERMLSAKKVIYDIDSSGTAQQLAQSLRENNLSQFKVEVDEVENDEIELEVKSL